MSWDEVIEQLRTWERQGHPADEADIDPPSTETIRLALRVAADQAAKGDRPPQWVVADANGGIVFELQSPGVSHSVHIHDSGKVEQIILQDHLLVHREELVIAVD